MAPSHDETQAQSGKLIQWMLGVGSVCIAAAIIGTFSILWTLNSTMSGFRAELNSIASRLTSIEASSTSSTAFRYTSQDAAHDREAFSSLLKPLMDRNLWQDDQISRLQTEMAKVLERQSVNTEALGALAKERGVK